MTARRQPPWGSAEPEAGSFGTWLRRQREGREISLRDVAERTKISLRYLEAMEDDRFDLLPAPVFAKGFLREYARYIGLSPDEVVNHYLSVHPQEASEGDEGGAPLRPSSGGIPRLWLGLVVLLLLLGLAAALSYYFYFRHPPASPSPAPAVGSSPGAPSGGVAGSVAATPMPAPPTGPPAAPAETAKAPLELALDFTGDCWVEALIDGKSRLAEQRVQGESLQIPAQESVVLTLGNAGGVGIQVNGLPFPLTAKQGEVVHDLKIDLETVRALREKKS